MRQRARLAIVLVPVALVAAACSDDEGGEATTVPTIAVPVTAPATPNLATTPPTNTSPPTTTAVDSVATTTATTAPAGPLDVIADEPFPNERCAANEAAGTITYLSGFDFAATVSIIDVILADEAGYYDELCLDVSLQPSFSTANYPFVASGEAQFASGGSFSEVVNAADANEAELVAVAVEGRSAIDSLILKPGRAATLEDLAGTTIGVKQALPPSVAAMLATAGLGEGKDYETVLVDGFDPLVHITLDGIVGFPGYRNNEPGTLERAGVPFDLFVPTDYDVPGSSGVIYTSRDFLDDHPTAVEDFVRATMRGLADALAEPDAASAIALQRIDDNGNPNFLSPEGETFRWRSDVDKMLDETADGPPPGVIEVDLLQAELDAYSDVGLFGDAGAPPASDFVAADLAAGIYDDTGTVIWPS
ncbi:MAG: ABC transporter substrate-binding protein [Acidimicrobiia bacterium]|nr:ABC transporter substrate-binding protein [Acidimicrobiia bacterium]